MGYIGKTYGQTTQEIHLHMCGELPSDIILLLAKSEWSFSNVTNFARNSAKSRSFAEILRVQNSQNPSKLTKNNSQGTIFEPVSCQRVNRK